MCRIILPCNEHYSRGKKVEPYKYKSTDGYQIVFTTNVTLVLRCKRLEVCLEEKFSFPLITLIFKIVDFGKVYTFTPKCCKNFSINQKK